MIYNDTINFHKPSQAFEASAYTTIALLFRNSKRDRFRFLIQKMSNNGQLSDKEMITSYSNNTFILFPRDRLKMLLQLMILINENNSRSSVDFTKLSYLEFSDSTIISVVHELTNSDSSFSGDKLKSFLSEIPTASPRHRIREFSAYADYFTSQTRNETIPTRNYLVLLSPIDAHIEFLKSYQYETEFVTANPTFDIQTWRWFIKTKYFLGTDRENLLQSTKGLNTSGCLVDRLNAARAKQVKPKLASKSILTELLSEPVIADVLSLNQRWG